MKRTRGSSSNVEPVSDPEPVTVLTVRVPKSKYDAMRRIVFEGKNAGEKVSLHSLALEGIDKVIAERLGA